MNFWTWLDRNGAGVFWLVVLVLLLGLPSVGALGEGCHLRCGPSYELHIGNVDGGSP